MFRTSDVMHKNLEDLFQGEQSPAKLSPTRIQ